jgi:endonuclease/exonuclease/phosphatase (EEP) superfamily protein YafD
LIVAGDLNDTSNSYIGRRLRQNMQDTFACAGWGTGVTFGQWTMQQRFPPFLHFLAFDYLRIDHVFCLHHFRVLQNTVLDISAFDHRPQIVRFVQAE